ncbi:MAG TPA: hypothetical protein VKA66_21370, partial [Mycobacterium sp.]|nr:hypothetical protein [Mycobacterium sp.]
HDASATPWPTNWRLSEDAQDRTGEESLVYESNLRGVGYHLDDVGWPLADDACRPGRPVPARERLPALVPR